LLSNIPLVLLVHGNAGSIGIGSVSKKDKIVVITIAGKEAPVFMP